MGMHVEYRNTLAAALAGSIKQGVFKSRARRFSSTLEAALFADNVPVQVYHNAIDVFRRRIPLWQRYFELRRRALRLGTLRHSDMWAPLAKTREVVSFEQAVRIICKGLAPLGEEYVGTIRTGCLKDRWVDVLPNKGKREGAFSWGAFGTLPYVLMSFTGDVTSLSVLAHELGHSMHSFLTWKSQPFVYAPYSTFIAEVASNVHQALVRAFLLRPEAKRDLQIAVLEEAMANFFRYLFVMPTLARFELETHQRVERGEALTAETMTDVMTDLLEEGYGKTVKVERTGRACSGRPSPTSSKITTRSSTRRASPELRPFPGGFGGRRACGGPLPAFPVIRVVGLSDRYPAAGRRRPRHTRAGRRSIRRHGGLYRPVECLVL